MPDSKSKAVTPAPSAEQPPLSKTEQFLEQNFKKIVWALALLAAVLLAVAIARHLSHERELESAAAFTSAKTVEDCDVIVQNYAGSRAAGNALLLKATLLWDAGKKESSVAALQDFIKNQADHPLLPHAQVALGSKQAALGEKDAARKTLEAVVRDHPKSEAAAAAQTQLGDMLWAEGKTEDAKKLFSELPRNHPGSPFIAEVDQRTKIMNAGLPSKEVDPPPAPPKPAGDATSLLPPIPGLPRPSSRPPTIDVPSLIPTPPGTPPPAPVPTPGPNPAPAAPPAPAPKTEEKPPASPKPETPSTSTAPAAPTTTLPSKTPNGPESSPLPLGTPKP